MSAAPIGAPRAQRPGGVGQPAGPAGNAPPPIVPLGMLGLAAVGLAAFGISVMLAADRAVSIQTSTAVVAATHAGVLLFLSTAVLGAAHQFGPVVGVHPLRSIAVAKATAVVFPLGAAMLAGGFAHGPRWVVPAGGTVVTIGVLMAAWNLSAPLAQRGKGVPVAGLGLAVAGLVLVVSLGLLYALSRDQGWFPLLPYRVLAHAHLGLLGWMGLAYISVAEKLWPMFLLSHRPNAKAGSAAVILVAVGVTVFVPALIFDHRALSITGGAIVIAGLGAHLTSLSGVIRHRKRPLELLHAFILSSAAFLVLAIALALATAFADVSVAVRAALAAAEVAALIAWLGLAIIGHSHRIVPFITWGSLRAKGVVTGPDGRPLLFQHLVDARLGVLTCVSATASFATLVGSLGFRQEVGVLAAGAGLVFTSVLAVANLGFGGRRVTRAAALREAAAQEAAQPSS